MRRARQGRFFGCRIMLIDYPPRGSPEVLTAPVLRLDFPDEQVQHYPELIRHAYAAGHGSDTEAAQLDQVLRGVDMRAGRLNSFVERGVAPYGPRGANVYGRLVRHPSPPAMALPASDDVAHAPGQYPCLCKLR